jgi:hypothetical protein
MTVTQSEPQSEGLQGVPHYLRGNLVEPSGNAIVEYPTFITPELNLDDLVWGRSEPGPAFDTPVSEIIDFLVEVGSHLDVDSNPHMASAMRQSTLVSPLGPRIVEQAYRSLPAIFERSLLDFMVDTEIGRARLDGWEAITDPSGRVRRIRAFPPRLVHVLAGNTPGVTAISIIRAALTKGVHLLKIPSDDLFTATAILRTMSDIAPQHPTALSFCAVYWRGGDTRVENAIFRAQYFDKLVAWGGEAAIRNAIGYVAPGFELVSFDPKVSLSIVGSEALDSDASIAESTSRAATDIALFNQSACASSRFVYIEANSEDDRLEVWCRRLAQELSIDRPYSDGTGVRVPVPIREQVNMYRTLGPDYQVWGDFEHGIVIRSEDPVDFHPEGKVVNVVAVEDLEDAFARVNVATQTIGIYPPERSAAWRDRLAARGMQRIVPLGEVIDHVPGMPHDGFFPLHRFVRWMVDDC